MRKIKISVVISILLIAIMLPAQSAVGWFPACEAKTFITGTDADLTNFSDPGQQVSTMTLKQNKKNVASNPGGIFFWAWIRNCNDGNVTIDLDVNKDGIHTDNFGYVSKNPIQIFVNGVKVYAGNVEPQTVPVRAGDIIVLSVHYKYVAPTAITGTYFFSANINAEIFQSALTVTTK